VLSATAFGPGAARWHHFEWLKGEHVAVEGDAALPSAESAADVMLVYRRSSTKTAEFDVELELTAQESLTTPLIPGFALDLAALFDR